MPSNISNKTTLRRALLADRQAIAPEVRRRWDAEIATRLISWWETHRPPSLGVYWPIRGEPDLLPAYAELTRRGVELALPVVAGKEAPLRFISWRPGDDMTRDAFGVSIPVNGIERKPAALLIPCVGFNEQYYRLGYGGGFYDRTLAVRPRPRTVGIAYSCALASFEADSHDIALDSVVTERSAIDID